MNIHIKQSKIPLSVCPRGRGGKGTLLTVRPNPEGYYSLILEGESVELQVVDCEISDWRDGGVTVNKSEVVKTMCGRISTICHTDTLVQVFVR